MTAPRLRGSGAPTAAASIGVGHRYPVDEPSNLTGGTGAPSPATLPDGWGTRPRCETCGRGFYGCICNMPEPEPEYFRPGVRLDPDGWNRVEL